ncbi:hypothetical protein GOV13_04445 [Candidatus Pacearchaeota archaeon]|nr:hypothetical protein [Candidatus Pacearchaeota archaeon]
MCDEYNPDRKGKSSKESLSYNIILVAANRAGPDDDGRVFQDPPIAPTDVLFPPCLREDKKDGEY